MLEVDNKVQEDKMFNEEDVKVFKEYGERIKKDFREKFERVLKEDVMIIKVEYAQCRWCSPYLTSRRAKYHYHLSSLDVKVGDIVNTMYGRGEVCEINIPKNFNYFYLCKSKVPEEIYGVVKKEQVMLPDNEHGMKYRKDDGVVLIHFECTDFPELSFDYAKDDIGIFDSAAGVSLEELSSKYLSCKNCAYYYKHGCACKLRTIAIENLERYGEEGKIVLSVKESDYHPDLYGKIKICELDNCGYLCEFYRYAPKYYCENSIMNYELSGNPEDKNFLETVVDDLSKCTCLLQKSQIEFQELQEELISKTKFIKFIKDEIPEVYSELKRNFKKENERTKI